MASVGFATPLVSNGAKNGCSKTVGEATAMSAASTKPVSEQRVVQPLTGFSAAHLTPIGFPTSSFSSLGADIFGAETIDVQAETSTAFPQAMPVYPRHIITICSTTQNYAIITTKANTCWVIGKYTPENKIRGLTKAERVYARSLGLWVPMIEEEEERNIQVVPDQPAKRSRV